ncbi:hypothetical protein D9615_008920 [Tricholomella constricta]|uniref:C2 domain-containing protein n=1 Tax=Tricholomella constricta TaxID=117010 RepID=A0A8H5LYH9_9AGAR|nr:hypothetical protein D9615_008920 [Tricholomella constricta]
MEPSKSSENVQIKVIKATGLPQVGIRTPDCKVSITVGLDSKVTQRVKSANPVWNEAFLFAADPGSKVIAEAVTSVKSEVLQAGIVALDENVPLKPLVLAIFHRRPTLILSFSVASPKDARAPDAREATTAAPTVKDLEAPLSAASARSPPNQKFPEIVGNLKQFINLGSVIAEVHPYAKVVWALLTSGSTILIEQYERDARIQDLWASVLETLDFMKDAEALRDVRSLTGTVQAMMEQLQYWGRSKAEIAFRAVLSAKDDTIIQGFTDTFAQLKVQFDQRVNIQQWKIIQATGEQVAMIFDKVVRDIEDRKLKDLLTDDLHTHWSSKCLSGTREKLLSDILSWAQSDSSSSMIWLSGAAGTGKSSVAGSVAEILKSKDILGAFVGFRRDTAVDDTPSHLFGSIAYQLAFFNEDLRRNILPAVNKELNMHMLPERARELIVQPLLKFKSVMSPIVIVIDALDECASDSGTKGKPGREVLVKALVTEFATLPSFVKYSSLQNIDLVSVDDTHSDIATYISFRCQEIKEKYTLDGWPKDADIPQLTLLVPILTEVMLALSSDVFSLWGKF